MKRLTNANILVRLVDSAEERIADKKCVFNFPFSQILLCTGGSGYFVAEGRWEMEFKEGNMVYVDQAMIYAIRTQNGISIKKLAVDTAGAPNFGGYFSDERFFLLKSASHELTEAFSHIYEAGRKAAVSESYNVSMKLYRLMANLGREYLSQESDVEAVCRSMIMAYINHIFEKFSALDKVEAPVEVDALIRRTYGISADELNTLFRLEMGKSYVVLSPSLMEAAHYLGFKNEEEFAKCFYERYGITAADYRSLYI